MDELKEKKLLEDNDDSLFKINIDEKNRHLINNIANRLFQRKCIPNLVFMKQATCCGHTANCGCDHVCPNVIAVMGKNYKPMGGGGGNNCNKKKNDEDFSKLYNEYKKNRQVQVQGQVQEQVQGQEKGQEQGREKGQGQVQVQVPKKSIRDI